MPSCEAAVGASHVARSFFDERHRVVGFFRDDDQVSVGVVEGELAAAVEVDLRAPLDLDLALQLLVEPLDVPDIEVERAGRGRPGSFCPSIPPICSPTPSREMSAKEGFSSGNIVSTSNPSMSR